MKPAPPPDLRHNGPHLGMASLQSAAQNVGQRSAIVSRNAERQAVSFIMPLSFSSAGVVMP